MKHFSYTNDTAIKIRPILKIVTNVTNLPVCNFYRETRSFFVELSHHHDSRASTKNVELLIITQNYLRLENVIAQDLLEQKYEVTNITGTVIIKVSNST